MNTFRVQRLDHVALNVTDVARARAFYGGLLGLHEIARPASFTFHGAWFQCGQEVVHLVGRKDPDADRSSHFALWVDDVRAAAKIFAGAGYAVNWDTTKIPGVDRFFVRDPDGNRVEIQGRDAL